MQPTPIILLAEDSPTQAAAVYRILEDAGFHVRVATDGACALDVARATTPDLVISDVVMPELGGLGLCAALKSDPALQRVPVILLTSRDETLDVIQGLQSRADRYLIKPPDPEQLIDATRALLQAPPAAESTPPDPCDVSVHGEVYHITASRSQIVALLLSTYESAQRINRDLRRAQENLRHQQEDLERNVRTRTTELEHANAVLGAAVAKLEAHDRARAQFIDNVSHELRTPLASMSYAITNLLRGVVCAIPESLRTYLLMFQADCERMKATVADILDLRRIDAQALVLNRMRIRLVSLVQRTAHKFAAEAADKNLTLTVEGRSIPGFVDADPLKLERILTNLLQNAIQFTPAKGHVQITVAPARDHHWIEIRVTDDGIGIAPEHLPHLTERYFRVGEFVAGTGLGLSLCKEILEQLGGELDLKSPPPDRDQGTQALVRLPLAPAPILLAVDDSKTVRLLIEHQLSAHGYQCQLAESAERAMAILRTATPDALIVDAVLPGIDGVQLIIQIKADHRLRHIPMVVITGAEVDRARREILEEFRIPVIGKPWREDELVECLEDAVFGKHYLQR
ncbi:MAG: response regulator [Lentisphaerae bacterium]|nr:response regulator [Lentisphaerota bacterium]